MLRSKPCLSKALNGTTLEEAPVNRLAVFKIQHLNPKMYEPKYPDPSGLMDKAAMPSVKPLSEISLSAQSNPSECCGKASGAGSDRSTSVFAGVECLEDDLEDPGFGGVS